MAAAALSEGLSLGRRPTWATVAIAVTLTAAIGAALLWLGPPGSDTAAHVYQRDLYRSEGFVTWDNHWYSGRHVFVTYSWLYYPLASAVGIRLLAALSLAVATGVFALLVDWKPAVLTFAVVWGLYAISGAYPFMLGIAFALLALLALRGGWWWLFPPLAVLAWGASPLAYFCSPWCSSASNAGARPRSRSRSSPRRSSSRTSTTGAATSRFRGAS